ncbi:hypothetical protein Glove_13g150 [Diversispora epigaea]|uniref:Uncharacterized protein n=1 Tax=Diversispora epigaea TaxID=1348612 RepID=A0A397JP28_9GLOM|nr:hypothetical protein Glove_13g150 [Diversispora epigaea]
MFQYHHHDSIVTSDNINTTTTTKRKRRRKIKTTIGSPITNNSNENFYIYHCSNCGA